MMWLRYLGMSSGPRLHAGAVTRSARYSRGTVVLSQEANLPIGARSAIAFPRLHGDTMLTCITEVRAASSCLQNLQ